MADFDTIHRPQFVHERQLVMGETFTITLREFDPARAAMTVRFICDPDLVLRPAGEAGTDLINDWKRRHFKTPVEAFA